MPLVVHRASAIACADVKLIVFVTLPCTNTAEKPCTCACEVDTPPLPLIDTCAISRFTIPGRFVAPTVRLTAPPADGSCLVLPMTQWMPSTEFVRSAAIACPLYVVGVVCTGGFV